MVRFDPTNPNRLTNIRWFFADSQPVIPLQAAFSSLNWTDRSARAADDGSIGEVGGMPRGWVDGSKPAGWPLTGTEYCGDAFDWLNGAPFTGAAIPIPFEVAPCCQQCLFTTKYGSTWTLVAPPAYSATPVLMTRSICSYEHNFISGTGPVWFPPSSGTPYPGDAYLYAGFVGSPGTFVSFNPSTGAYTFTGFAGFPPGSYVFTPNP